MNQHVVRPGMGADPVYVWNAYEVGNGDLVVCEEGNADAWLRSDTVVPLVDAADDGRADRRPAPE